MVMKHLFIIAAALVLASCGGNSKKDGDPLADSGRTVRTEALLQHLKEMGDSAVYMVGHHDDTMYGIGWVADTASDASVHQRSDIKSVCGDFPAVLSSDLGHIELGQPSNLDGVSFGLMLGELTAHYNRGGLVSLSWTVDKADKSEAEISQVAHFLNSLQTPYGDKVPVVFRLRGAFDKSLWQKTVQLLKSKGVVNALYAYSPGTEPEGDATKYLERYPGDDIIDILGIDSYCVAPEGDTAQVAAYATRLDRNLDMVCRIAREHDKAVAVTETGFEGIRTNDWWTHTLAPVLSRHPISYVLVWRNAHDKPGHFFAPYPGHSSVSDFVQFYNDPQTLFLRDVNGLYLSE